MHEQIDTFKQNLTEEEYLIWQVIERRQGKDNPIKVRMLVWQTGIDERRAREIVAHLVLAHGKLIGSATGVHPGFYVITDKEELDEHLRSLRHRGIMCLVRASALSKRSLEDIFGQARLEMEAKDEQD